MAKSDLLNSPNSSSNLTGESSELDRLFKKYPRSTTGNIVFVSSTSGTTYDMATYLSGLYNNQGEQGMLLLLQSVLANYMINASDFNNKVEQSVFNSHTADYTSHGIDIIRLAKTSTGTANALVIDTAGTFDLTKDGNVLPIVPNLTNTGASTIAVDAQTVKPIKKFDIGTDTYIDTEAEDLKKNAPTQLVWSVGSDFFILRPSGGANVNGQAEITFRYAETINAKDVLLVKPDIVKLADPLSLPTSNSNGLAISSDGVYYALANASTPYLTIYKRNGDTFTKLANPSLLPTSLCHSAAFSPDGTHLALSCQSAPFVEIYKREGDVFTRLDGALDTVLVDTGRDVVYSSDGIYLAIAEDSSPYVAVYKRNGDVYNKLSNPATLPVGQSFSVDFSPDGTYLVVGHISTPFITIYKRSGDVFTKLANPATLPNDYVRGISFSSNGIYLALAINTTPFVNIYKRSGDVFTKLANPATLISSTTECISFSPDGTYLAVGHLSTPFITIYKRNSDDVFTKLANPSLLPPAVVNSIRFGYNGSYLVVAHSVSPYITIYTFNKAYKSTNSTSDILSASYLGYAKLAGIANDFKTIVKLWGGA
jgi:WD40 repeat protein